MPQAANAPQAEGLHAGGRQARAERPRVMREHAAPWGADTQPPAFPAGSDPFDVAGDSYLGSPPRTPPKAPPAAPAATPVYASHPRRLGVAALLVALCVIVALVAFVAWKTRAGAPPAPPIAGADSDSSVMSAFPPDATPQRQTRASAPSTAASQPPPAGASSATSQPAGTAAITPTPVEIRPLPVKPARKPASAPAPKSTSPSAPTIAAPEPIPAPAPPPVVAAPRKASPVADRWAQMSEELSRCTREDFIARVLCDQRVRFRYCDGFWGKTAQCPGNPVPDRGQ